MTAQSESSALADLPPWLREGEVVVALTTGTSDVATDVVVTRITKTQIVCTRAGQESRFRRRDLREMGERSAWYGRTLWPRDAPRVVELRAKARRISVAHAVTQKMDEWRRTGERRRAHEAVALLREWLTATASEDSAVSTP